jgi:hypothetical protein
LNNTGQQKNIMRYAGLGTQWMAMLLLAVWGGYKLDQRLWKAPVFVILFPLASLVLSFRQLINTLNKPKK